MMLCDSVVVVTGGTDTVDAGVNGDVDIVADAGAVDIVAGIACVDVEGSNVVDAGAIAVVVDTGCVAVAIRGFFKKTIAFGPVVLSVVVTLP